MMKYAIAIVSVCGLAAFAASAETWFDGGIGGDWPETAGMNGGWSGTEGATYVAGEPGHLSVDSVPGGVPLVFTADEAMTAGGEEVDAVTVSATVKIGSYPDFPDELIDANVSTALAAVEENEGVGYYALTAFGGADGENAWTRLGAAADLDQPKEVTVTFSTDAGTVYAAFTVDGTEFAPVALNAGATVAVVGFAGRGAVHALAGSVTTASAGPWTEVEEADVSGVTEENREQVESTLEEIQDALDALGEAATEADVGEWLATVYGGEKVPAATLIAAKNVALSVRYDLPLMLSEEPTVEFTGVDGDGDFAFSILDGETPLSLEAATSKILSMLKFTDDLGEEFGEATAEDVEVEVDGSTATVTFTRETSAGFLKVRLGAE